ncbi:hypothetical protein ACO0SA_004334 [Hanseniaspora valbyensis]
MSATLLPKDKNLSSIPVQEPTKLSDKYPVLKPWKWSYTGTVNQINANSLDLTLASKDSNCPSSTIKYHEFIDQYVPEFKNNAHFSLKPALFTGMLQTLALANPGLNKYFKVYYGRELFTYKDGGVCSIDYVMSNDEQWIKKYNIGNKTAPFDKEAFDKDAQETHPKDWPRLHPRTRYFTEAELTDIKTNKITKPLILISHGLCGGSHETIIRAAIDKIDLNLFDVAVINSRGCARTKIVTEKLFSAYSTDDLREVVNTKLKENPDRSIYMIGFSFGATILSNYLGEEGEKCPVRSAVTVCNPWDMIYSYEKMTFDFWASRLCSKSIVKFLVRTVEVNMPALENCMDPENTRATHVFTKDNLKKAKQFKTTVEFDDTFTAPYMGFKNAVEYYSNAGSINRLPNIKIPLLVINAEDDPVVGETSKNLKNAVLNNENVMYISTSLGGHLAYLTSNNDSWITKPIANYFKNFEEHIEK